MFSMKKVIIAGVFIACITSKLYGPIFGPFPGLERMISSSEAIAVVTIGAKIYPNEERMLSLRNDYKVYVNKALKGDITSDTKTLSLRYLPMLDLYAAGEFYIGQRILVFLRRYEENGKVIYHSVDTEGAHIELALAGDFKNIEGLSPEKAIPLLLHEYIDYRQKEIKIIRKSILNEK